MRIILIGANGKMSQLISKLLVDDITNQIVAGVDRSLKSANSYPVYLSPFEIKEQADIIIDFSNPLYLKDMLEYAKDKKTTDCDCDYRL